MDPFVDNIVSGYLRSSVAKSEARAKKREQARLREQKRVLKVETKKQELLSDPTKIDTFSSKVAAGLAPGIKKPRWSKHATKVEAVEATIPSDHPMKGFTEEFQQRYQEALTDPRYEGVPSKEIGIALANQMYSGEDTGSGTRHEVALKYKAQRDHDLSRLFGLLGEDTSIKKPVGYDEYLKKIKDTPAENIISPGKAAIEGAVISAGMRFAAMGVAKTSLPWLAAKAGASVAAIGTGPAILTGAAVGGVAILGYQAIKTALDNSIYGKTHPGGKWLSPSTWDKPLIELGGSALLAGGVTKAGLNALKKSVKYDIVHKGLLAQFAKVPSAKTAIKLGEIQRFNMLGKEAVDKIKVPSDAVYEGVKAQENIAAEKWGAFRQGLLKEPRITDEFKEGLTLDITGLKLPKRSRPNTVGVKPPETGYTYKPGQLGGAKTGPKPLYVGETGLEVLQPAKTGSLLIDDTGTFVARPATKMEKADYYGKMLNKEVPTAQQLPGNPKREFSNFTEEQVALTLKRAKTLGIDKATMEVSYGKKLTDKLWQEEKKIVPTTNKYQSQGVEVFSNPKATYTQKIVPGAITPRPGMEPVVRVPKLNKRVETEIDDVLDAVDSVYSGIGSKASDNAMDLLDDVMDAGGTKIEDFLIKVAGVKGGTSALVKKLEGLVGRDVGEVTKELLSYTKGVKVDTERIAVRTALQKAVRGRVEKFSPAEEAVLSKTSKVKEYVDELVDETFEYAEETARHELTGMLKWAIAGATLVPIVGLIGAPEAEAFPIKAMISKMFTRGAKTAAASGSKGEATYYNWMYDNTYTALPVNGSKTLPTPMLSKKGSGSMSADVVEKFESMVKGIRRTKGFMLFADRFMSTAGAAKVFFKAGASPATELGHRHIATNHNVDNAFKVANNILASVPGMRRDGAKIAAEYMKPLATEYQDKVVALGAAEFQMNRLKDTVESMTKDLVKKKVKKSKLIEHKAALETAKEKLTKLSPVRNNLQGEFKAFELKWNNVAEKLASESPGARIALAAEDTMSFTKYPWLKPMMGVEEREAVSYIKSMMLSFKERSKNAGLEVIENKPYMHHAFHPSWNEARMKKYLASLDIDVGLGTPMTKFWHRSKYSKMMMPDIQYTLQRYIPDAEKRIQWSSFWGKGENSWSGLAKHPVVQSSPALSSFFSRLKQMTTPESMTRLNDWANRYSAVEVFRLLAVSPSVAFKHAFKLVGTWANLGIGPAAKHLPETFKLSVSSSVNSRAFAEQVANLGVTGKRDLNVLKKLAIKTYTHQSRMLSNMVDMELAGKYTSKFDSVMRELNKKGGSLVRAVEAFDRAHSFLATMDMAAKKGLTAKDAMYSVMDTILTNNFLSGALNPIWMKDPKVRAIFLFQNTPFKIMERRLIGAHATVRVGKKIINFAKTDKKAFMKEVRDLKQYITTGQDELKKGIIMDALNAEKGLVGSNIVSAFMKEMLLVSGLLIGGKSLLGWNLGPQTFHTPFLREDSDQFTLATSPVINSFFKTKGDLIRSHERGEDTEFFMTEFMQNWLGKGKGIPVTIHKALRLSRDDIPARYVEGSFPAFQYFFAVPTVGAH